MFRILAMIFLMIFRHIFDIFWLSGADSLYYYSKGDSFMILNKTLMNVLDSIQPEKATTTFDFSESSSDCGCTGNCGQSCSGDCEAGVAQEVVIKTT